MTPLGRTVLFVFCTVMVLGAMLLTVHWAHAQMTQDKAERAIELQAIKQYHCQDAQHCPGAGQFDKDGKYIPPQPLPPERAQINACIAYANKIVRGVQTTDVKDPETKRQIEKMDDWLYFCMQQARWSFCDKCQVDPDHNWDRHQSCSEAGPAAYYNDECWEWLHNLFHSTPLPKSQARAP